MIQKEVQQLDIQSVNENGSLETTFTIEYGTGFIVIKNAVLASVGVLRYLGKKLGLEDSEANQFHNVFQSEEDLFKADNINGVNGLVLTDEHPVDQMVEIWENGNFEQFGFSLSNGRKIGKYLVNDIKITSQVAIKKILDGESIGFSLGYEVEYQKSFGIYKDGEEELEYTFVKFMKNINHIALTNIPRNKETIFTDNSDDNNFKKGSKSMKKKFIFIGADGKTNTISTDSVDDLVELQNQQTNDFTSLLDENIDLKKKIETLENDSEVDNLKEENKKLKEKLENLQKDQKDKETKQANDNLKADVLEYANKQNIKVSNDSADVEEVIKTVLNDSAIDTKDMDLNSMKTAYTVLKSQQKNTMDQYSFNDSEDEKSAKTMQQLENDFFGGINYTN